MIKPSIKKHKKKERLKPISLYPLTPEEAILAFMKTDSKPIFEAEKRERRRRSRRKAILSNE
jgi:spore cortex formation protein SpoVR/YcgB (stage V sporulation)